MFKKGDIVRIKKEFLESYEDPNKDYVVFESYDNNHTKVFAYSKLSSFGGYIYEWSSDVFYKVGHIELEG